MQSVHMRLDNGPSLFQCNLNIWDQLAPTVIMIERILWLVMSFLNILNIINATLAKGVRREKKKKAFVNPNLLGRASKFLVRSLNNIIYSM